MALVKAVAIGAIAAIGIPYLLRGHISELYGVVREGLVRIDLGSVHLLWSWTLFALVTLFAWGFLAWADR